MDFPNDFLRALQDLQLGHFLPVALVALIVVPIMIRNCRHGKTRYMRGADGKMTKVSGKGSGARLVPPRRPDADDH